MSSAYILGCECIRQFGRSFIYSKNKNEVITNVESELRGSGRSAGYRAMHQRLIIKYGQRINRESVRLILKALDPEGVEDRSRRRLRRRKYRAKGLVT